MGVGCSCGDISCGAAEFRNLANKVAQSGGAQSRELRNPCCKIIRRRSVSHQSFAIRASFVSMFSSPCTRKTSRYFPLFLPPNQFDASLNSALLQLSTSLNSLQQLRFFWLSLSIVSQYVGAKEIIGPFQERIWPVNYQSQGAPIELNSFLHPPSSEDFDAPQNSGSISGSPC